MNENLFATKVYENITTFRLEQNKAKTNPISKAKKMLLRLTINERRESFGYYADEIEAAKASEGFDSNNHSSMLDIMVQSWKNVNSIHTNFRIRILLNLHGKLRIPLSKTERMRLI